MYLGVTNALIFYQNQLQNKVLKQKCHLKEYFYAKSYVFLRKILAYFYASNQHKIKRAVPKGTALLLYSSE